MSSIDTSSFLQSSSTDIEAFSLLRTSQIMKTFAITTLLALTTITIACPGDIESCGWRMTGDYCPRVFVHHVLNKLTVLGYTQSDLAKAVCGRTDTCGGREWNSLFIARPDGSLEAGSFCAKGCFEPENSLCRNSGRCH